MLVLMTSRSQGTPKSKELQVIDEIEVPSARRIPSCASQKAHQLMPVKEEGPPMSSCLGNT